MAEKISQIVILLGPPGAGKGTQAEILAEELDFFHFETSKIIEEELKSHLDNEVITVEGKEYSFKDERKNFYGGTLNTPAVVAFWVKKKIRELAEMKKPIIFSGSPRTIFEAQVLMPFLENLFDKNNIRALLINIPEQESIFRNSHRRICEACRMSVPYLPAMANQTECSRCGGKLITRGVLDNPEIISVRLQEYSQRTAPVIDFLKIRGVSIKEIDGVGSIDTVAQRITEALKHANSN